MMDVCSAVRASLPSQQLLCDVCVQHGLWRRACETRSWRREEAGQHLQGPTTNGPDAGTVREPIEESSKTSTTEADGEEGGSASSKSSGENAADEKESASKEATAGAHVENPAEAEVEAKTDGSPKSEKKQDAPGTAGEEK